jgi:gamma-glutamyltranspeptidase
MAHAIAAPEPAATAAGERALRAGGNAVDAALAAAATLTVTFPHMCGLGGDMFALVRQPDGTTTSINASGPAPRAADAAALRRRVPAMPIVGPDAVTVPGVVAGWDALHAAGATLGWPALLADAIELAEEGVIVSRSLGDAIDAARAGILADRGLAGVLAPAGTPLGRGDRLGQPALARTLRELAGDGPRALYDGPLGERLAAGLQRAGCVVDRADLQGFAPELTAPLRGRFRDLDVLTSPPNSSGILLTQALAVLDAAGADLEPLGADAGLLAEVLRLGSEQRDAALGDPLTVDVDTAAWLGEARVQELLELASAAAAGARAAAVQRTPLPGGDTIAIVTADADGRAVSLIQSLFHSFGAQLLEPDTGITLHNRGSYFSLEPGHPNELAPGRRPVHTLMPVLVEAGGSLRYVLGTMGGRAHAQIHAQVLLRLLAGMSAQEAVTAPRWIVGGMARGEPDDTLRLEDGLDPVAVEALLGSGLRPMPLPRFHERFGHAQAIAVAPDGAPDAGSDPRSGTTGG